MGPCWYPAGHIWHFYLGAWYIHNYAQNPEFIMKLIHTLMHTLMCYLVSKMAYMYFRDKKQLAQLICFILIDNQGLRQFFQLMYNDIPMSTYCCAALYYLMKNKPMIAVFLLSMGMSIKAGAILMLTIFLGLIQYNYGSNSLLFC